jgi:hypothetical protein
LGHDSGFVVGEVDPIFRARGCAGLVFPAGDLGGHGEAFGQIVPVGRRGQVQACLISARSRLSMTLAMQRARRVSGSQSWTEGGMRYSLSRSIG